jgi:hypothetical protein
LLDEAMFCADKTNVTDYAHFSADIISSPSTTVYERKHDMYSLGILMWEFWSQQSVFGHQMSEIADLKACIITSRHVFPNDVILSFSGKEGSKLFTSTTFRKSVNALRSAISDI